MKVFSKPLIIILCSVLLIFLVGCMTPLGKAAQNGDVKAVQTLLASGADLSERADGNYSALDWAAMNGHLKIVKILIENGADVNSGAGQATALHVAAYFGQASVVRSLLEAGADPGIGNYQGKTPLQLARERGHIPIVHMLQEAEENRYIAIKKPASVTTKEIPIAKPAATTPAATADMTVSSPDFGFYHALVIGNNDYRYLPKLQTAINDAKAIVGLFQDKYGFKVRLLVNASRADILLAINSYRQTLTNRDNLLIYYAGHGWLDKDADQGYWLPVDAAAENQVEWVSNSAITSEIRAIQAKHVMVVADSCYSGKLSRGLHIIQRTPDYLARISRKKARVVLSSGGLEPVMDSGGKGNHSVFASAFIEILNDNNGVLDGTTLFTKIREQVGWNADQIPEYADIHKAGHEGGDFLFVRQR